MNTHNLANCTHEVPPNSLGYFAMHCLDNQKLPDEAVSKMIEGPLTAMQEKLTESLAQPGEDAPADS